MESLLSFAVVGWLGGGEEGVRGFRARSGMWGEGESPGPLELRPLKQAHSFHLRNGRAGPVLLLSHFLRHILKIRDRPALVTLPWSPSPSPAQGHL